MSILEVISHARRFQLILLGTFDEEDPSELAGAKYGIQFGHRGVNEKQNEDPDLYGCESMPGEVHHDVFSHATEGSPGGQVFT